MNDDDPTEPRAHVRAYDAIQQAHTDAILSAEFHKARDAARAHASELLAEWQRLMTLDNTPLEVLYPGGDAEGWPDYTSEIDAIEQQLNTHMREHYDHLVDQPIWREWFAPGDEPARPRTVTVAAPILNDDPPF